MTIKHAWLIPCVLLLLVPGTAARAGQNGATLVDVVRGATQPYVDYRAAIQAGWANTNSCVSGPQEGAMGIHFVNEALIMDDEVVAETPEALMYEVRNGQLRLLGVEYIVIADAWNMTHPAPPVLLGQQFHYVGSPNRYGLPAFYELHVWAWKKNPNGTFVDWNPRVSCDGHTTDAAAHAH